MVFGFQKASLHAIHLIPKFHEANWIETDTTNVAWQENEFMRKLLAYRIYLMSAFATRGASMNSAFMHDKSPIIIFLLCLLPPPPLLLCFIRLLIFTPLVLLILLLPLDFPPILSSLFAVLKSEMRNDTCAVAIVNDMSAIVAWELSMNCSNCANRFR